MPEEKKATSNKMLIMIIVLLALLVGAGIFIIAMFLSDSDKNDTGQLVEVNDDGTLLTMEMESHLVLDESDLLSPEELQKQIDEGKINLKFSNIIDVENGKDGTCDIANSSLNTKDIYVSLWLVDTQEEIYRSGVIPVGKKIQQLELNRSLEKGDYKGILVYNQLKDDKIVGQVNVEVTLKVNS